MSAVARVVEVLKAHRASIGSRGISCTCRRHGIAYRPEQWTGDEYRTHVANELEAAGVLCVDEVPQQVGCSCVLDHGDDDGTPCPTCGGSFHHVLSCADRRLPGGVVR